MCDYELGIHNSFLNFAVNELHLARFAIEGCHMHYCSSIVKHVKDIGLSRDYSAEDSGFGHFVSKLFALAFVPAFLMQFISI